MGFEPAVRDLTSTRKKGEGAARYYKKPAARREWDAGRAGKRDLKYSREPKVAKERGKVRSDCP